MSAEKIVNTNENNFPPIETPTFKEEKINLLLENILDLILSALPFLCLMPAQCE